MNALVFEQQVLCNVIVSIYIQNNIQAKHHGKNYNSQ